MSELTKFLRARYHEKQELALAASPDSWKVVEWTNTKGREFLVVADYGIRPAFAMEGQANADYIADNDPAYVLRDIESKLLILTEYELACDATYTGEEVSAADIILPYIRLLAFPFAHHPDYKESFRP